MKIRERLADLVDGGRRRVDIETLKESVRRLWDAYQDGPFIQTPQQVVKALREGALDAGVLEDLLYQLEYEVLAGYGVRGTASERERKLAVDASRRLWKYNPLVQWVIWMWTNYGFGETVKIVPQDPAAQSETDDEGNVVEIGPWDEFWTAPRNNAVLGEDRIHEQSNDMLVDGEVFWVYHASTADGESTVGEIDPDEVVEIVRHPDDGHPLFYKRSFDLNGAHRTWFYPDWQAYFSGELDRRYGDGKTLAETVGVKDESRTDKMRAKGRGPGTVAVVQHVAYNRKDRKSPRGWPLTTNSASYFRMHTQHVRNRLAVSSSKAMYVRRLPVKGGSRGVKGVLSQIASNLSSSQSTETNPPAAPGSTAVTNQAVDWEEFPMTTGADSGKLDNELFAWYPLIGMGVYPHYGGLGDAYRLATATSMEKPVQMQFSRYRLFWSSQFRRMVEIVLRFKEKFGSMEFETYGAEVSMDRMVEVDLDGLTTAIGKMFGQVITPLATLTAIPSGVVNEVLKPSLGAFLQALGADVSVDALFEPEEEGPEEVAPPAVASLSESHVPLEVERTCPLCGFRKAYLYEGHGGLLVCVNCLQTYDPELEVWHGDAAEVDNAPQA